MPVYKAPLRDMKFLLNEVFDYPGHYTRLKTGENATPDIVDAILNECGKFCEEVLSPLYQSGDEEGCKLITAKSSPPKAIVKPINSTRRADGRACLHRRSTAGRDCRPPWACSSRR